MVAIHRARVAVASIFFVNGAVLASWVPHIPAVKSRPGAGEAALGWALVAMAAGAVVALPLAGWLVGRFGSRVMTRSAAAAFCLAMPLPVFSPTLPMLALSLAVLGSLERAARRVDECPGSGARARGRPADHVVLSRPVQHRGDGRGPRREWCHGSRQQRREPCDHGRDADAGRGRAGGSSTPAEPVGGRASGTGVRPAVACARGAGYPRVPRSFGRGGDGRLERRLPARDAGLQLGGRCYRLCRLFPRDGCRPIHMGDTLVSCLGARAVLRGSGCVAAIGLGGALLIGHPLAGTIGCALVGLGIANIIPVLFSAATRVAKTEPGTALAAVATIGYGGFLSGPSLIGITAEAAGLPIALGLVSAACVLVALLAGSVSGGRIEREKRSEARVAGADFTSSPERNG